MLPHKRFLAPQKLATWSEVLSVYSIALYCALSAWPSGNSFCGGARFPAEFHLIPTDRLCPTCPETRYVLLIIDPVTAIGLAASVADLAELALKLFLTLCQHYRSIRDAPAKSAELRAEVETILDLASTLKETVEQNPTKILLQQLLTRAVNELLTLLRELQKRVEPANVQGFQRLKWPFKESENDKYIAKIERYKNTFNLALNMYQTYDPISFLLINFRQSLKAVAEQVTTSVDLVTQFLSCNCHVHST